MLSSSTNEEPSHQPKTSSVAEGAVPAPRTRPPPIDTGSSVVLGEDVPPPPPPAGAPPPTSSALSHTPKNGSSSSLRRVISQGEGSTASSQRTTRLHNIGGCASRSTSMVRLDDDGSVPPPPPPPPTNPSSSKSLVAASSGSRLGNGVLVRGGDGSFEHQLLSTQSSFGLGGDQRHLSILSSSNNIQGVPKNNSNPLSGGEEEGREEGIGGCGGLAIRGGSENGSHEVIPRTGHTRLSKADYEVLYCKLSEQELDDRYGEFIGYTQPNNDDSEGDNNNEGRGTTTTTITDGRRGTTSGSRRIIATSLPSPPQDVSTQTGNTRREESVGIVWRAATPALLPLIYLFLAPIFVIVNAISYFLHWKPIFLIRNAQTNNYYYGEETPFMLQLMGGGVFYFMFVTYLVVLPACYAALTSGSHQVVRKGVIATVFFFIAAFPPWAMEAFLIFAPLNSPYAVTDFMEHNDYEELRVMTTMLPRSSTLLFYVSLVNAVVLGVFVLAAPWFVYASNMADIMQRKARIAADEYIRDMTEGRVM